MEWKHEVDIKTAIHEAKEMLDTGAAEAVTVARLGEAIASALSTLPPAVRTHFTTLIVDFRSVRNRSRCDNLLSALYELADFHAVWLGL